MTAGFQLFLAVLVGQIGGRARKWSMTLVGLCAMAVAPLFGDYAYSHSLRIDKMQVIATVVYLAILLAFGSAAHQWTATRPRTIRIGFCRKCDYNLTGNVSGRCPECGTMAKEDVITQ